MPELVSPRFFCGRVGGADLAIGSAQFGVSTGNRLRSDLLNGGHFSSIDA